MVYALKNTDLKLNLEDPNSNIVEKMYMIKMVSF